jgi:5-hydroxyisourate hydrolase-like protein (transthyretin family)
LQRSKLNLASAQVLIQLATNEGGKEGKAYAHAEETREAKFELLLAAVEYFGQLKNRTFRVLSSTLEQCVRSKKRTSSVHLFSP